MLKNFSNRIVEFFKGHPILLGILVISFLLRIAGILWGIPVAYPIEYGYHPDEPKVITAAVMFPGDIFNNPHLQYPTFLAHFLAVITLPLRFLLYVLGLPTSTFYNSVTVIGRFLSVLAGTGAVLLTYFLARDIYDKRRALLASVFLSLSLYHVQNSSFATTDVLTSFFLVLFLYILRRAFLLPEKTNLYVVLGLTLGLLVGTKYPGIIAIIVILVMYIYTLFTKSKNEKTQDHINMGKWHLNLLLFGCIAVVTFFITTPGIIFRFNDFIDAMRLVMTDLGRSYHPRTDPETWLIVFRSVTVAVGFPLASLFIFGLFFPYKKNSYDMSFIVLLIVFFVCFGSILRSRYVIMVMPLIAMIASNGALWLYGLPCKAFKVLSALVITFVIGYSIGYCLTGTYLRYNDTRTQAARYIQSNIPVGESIGIGYISEKWDWSAHPWKYPNIDFTRFRYMNFLDYPKIVVLSSFDFVQIEGALKSDKLSKDYIWDKKYNKEWYEYSPPSPHVFEFYDELLNPDRSKYLLLKSFEKTWYVPIWPHKAELASPEIRIYIRKY